MALSFSVNAWITRFGRVAESRENMTGHIVHRAPFMLLRSLLQALHSRVLSA